MKLSLFDYSLPQDLIAQHPVSPRDHSKLLVCDRTSQTLQDKHFYDIIDILTPNDVLVINTSRTLHARLQGFIDIYPQHKAPQKKQVEILLHTQISPDTRECLWYPGKNLKIGRIIEFCDDTHKVILTAEILKVSEMGRYIKFSRSGYELFSTLERIGKLPLPPYITQELENDTLYQTIYAKEFGSAATPTAWLHFTRELLQKLTNKWVIIEEVLLHVWVWTFKPVEDEEIENHYIHQEHIEISEEVAHRLNTYKTQGKHIIAIGTTSVRTLESFCDETGTLYAWKKETRLFIYPWYNWRFVDGMITNFHLPKSTLLMLVASFWGREFIMQAYLHAIQEKYRFFSFWDAMLIQ